MKIWLPYLKVGSGADVFTENLARALGAEGHETVLQSFDGRWHYAPWPLRMVTAPSGISVIVSNVSYGFSFKRPNANLLCVEHHCVFDEAYAPYRSVLQAMYHECVVRGFERASLNASDRVVTPSDYTAASLRRAMGVTDVEVIPNGIDTEFFSPAPHGEGNPLRRPARLLFVGNLTRRKGADLLPEIMLRLGDQFELRYTQGLRSKTSFSNHRNMTPLGRLDGEALREEYRRADLLLFPTRFEGFGYAAAEAMSCGTPVVATASSSLPEIVQDGVTGRLCPFDDVDAFAEAVRELAADHVELRRMGERARAVAVEKFGLRQWGQAFSALIEKVCNA